MQSNRTSAHRRLANGGGAALLLLLLTAACNVPRWDFEYGFGQQRATSEKKPLLLYFTDLMAGPHYEFDKQVLQQAVVQREMVLLVNVALSYQWGPAPKQFNILKPEVCVLCKPDGSEIARIEVNPPPAPETFAAWLRDTKAQAGFAAPTK